MRYFTRINGVLREVHPITKPHRTQSVVTVRDSRDGNLRRVESRDLILHY